MEANLVTDLGRSLDFFSNPFGYRQGGDPSGLGAADDAVCASTGLQAHLGQLGGLTAAGVTDNDQNLVVANSGND